MANRRRFLEAIAFLATAGGTGSAFGARGRRQRRLARNRTVDSRFPKLPPVQSFADAYQYGYEYADENVDVQIPNRVPWLKLRSGMTAQEVERLLDAPLEGNAPVSSKGSPEVATQAQSRADAQAYEDLLSAEYHADQLLNVEGWSYGSITFPAHEVLNQWFTVSFLRGKLHGVTDPFNGAPSKPGERPKVRWSVDGRPTTPVILAPHNQARFQHCPFIVDYRWLPSSGIYPMEYALEVSCPDGEYSPELDRFVVSEWNVYGKYTTAIPHVEACAPGGGLTRWRVKAKNGLGESDWSEYRHYRFGLANG